MKKETNLTLKQYQKTLEGAVKFGVRYNAARKALEALPLTYAVETALVEIKGQLKLWNNIVKNTTHNIAVLELKEGI